MAKVKFSALVSEMRNKLNGSVFSKNRGGNYLRNKVTPSNPQTSHQVAVRARLTSFSQQWRSLTQTQIAAWRSAVGNFSKTDIFGDIRHPSGINLFVKLNVNLARIGVASLTDPPAPGTVEAVTSIIVTASSITPSLSVAYLPTPVPANTKLVVSATPLESAGKNFVKSEFRDIAIINAATASPYNALAAYTARFGALIAGQQVFFKLTPINDVTGQAGQALQGSAIVA